MNRILKIIRRLFFFICMFPSLLSAQETSIDMVLRDGSLEEAIEFLEKDYDFLFSYKEEDVKGVKINIDIKNADIKTVLNKLLEKEQLQFEITNGKYIILSLKTGQDSPLFKIDSYDGKIRLF